MPRHAANFVHQFAAAAGTPGPPLSAVTAVLGFLRFLAQRAPRSSAAPISFRLAHAEVDEFGVRMRGHPRRVVRVYLLEFVIAVLLP